jgi:hypothetical protein
MLGELAGRIAVEVYETAVGEIHGYPSETVEDVLHEIAFQFLFRAMSDSFVLGPLEIDPEDPRDLRLIDRVLGVTPKFEC